MKSTGLVFAEKPSIGIEPTRLFDRSRWGHHGTITGATWIRLPSGLWVLNFAGGTNKVATTTAGWADLSTANSFAVWIQVHSNPPSYASNIFSKAKIARGLLWSQAASTLYFGADTNLTAKWAYSAYTPSETTWLFVVGTWDGSKCRLYINGPLVDTANETDTWTHDATEFCMFNVLEGDQPLDGACNRGTVLTRALTAGQILKRFNAERHWFGV